MSGPMRIKLQAAEELLKGPKVDRRLAHRPEYAGREGSTADVVAEPSPAELKESASLEGDPALEEEGSGPTEGLHDEEGHEHLGSST